MPLNRRSFLAAAGASGLGGTLFPGVLYGMAVQPGAAPGAEPALRPITPEMIDAAAALAGVPIAPDQRQMMLDGLNEQRDGYAKIRALRMPNSVAPAYVFDPLPPGATVNVDREPTLYGKAPSIAGVVGDPEALAFATVLQLGELLRRRKVTSLALTQMYLARLKRYDPLLHFVAALTEERALAQAREADTEMDHGRYRGPLHGIPWGAKDLLAVRGYPTAWGATVYEHQQFDEDATVVQRLDAAGAVLVAKLTLGALAMGDVWYGGRTRNPWNPAQGSSGSSAGPASATAAGCVGFAIGSETLGSIESPSTRCGVTGLRPTFGFVPRTGAMALSWTMDKLGPICRAVEDCAAVMNVIYGPDGADRSVRNAAFNWNANTHWRDLKVGYLADEFALHPPAAAGASPMERAWVTQARYDHPYGQAALAKLGAMGLKLKPLSLPQLPYPAMANLLSAEAAAAFDELTMSGRAAQLTAQGPDDWPNIFRVARLYPAVEYIQANRARLLAIEQLSALFQEVDVIVAPSDGKQLTATNLTGHPAVIVPNGLRGADAPKPEPGDSGQVEEIGGPGTPVSITFLGGHYRDAQVLLLARAYQEATGFEKLHPPLPA